MAKEKDEGFPTSRQVDGNNVETFYKNPKPLQVEKGHTDWTNSVTGKRTEKPEWAGEDRDY